MLPPSLSLINRQNSSIFMILGTRISYSALGFHTRHSDFTLGTRIEKNMASEIFTQFIEASCKILKFKLNQVKDDMRYCIFFMGFFYFFLNECNHRYISKLRKRNWKIYCWGIPFSNVHRLACHAP